MEKIITIIPLSDISELHIDTANPATKRKVKIAKSEALKFMQFDKTRKGAIEAEELFAIKGEVFDVNSLPDYEAKLSFKIISDRLNKTKKILKKLGRTDIYVSPENFKDLLNEETAKLQEEIEALKAENDKLKRENGVIIETINESVEPERNITPFERSLPIDESFVDEERSKLIA